VVFSPFENYDIFASVPSNIINVVVISSDVFDENFFARTFGTIDTTE
jgi:hypothetical protein